MNKSVIAFFGLAIASLASEGPWMVPDNLVDISDHILTARVTGVVIPGAPDVLTSDYLDRDTQLKMDLMVLTNEVLKSTATEIPNSIVLEIPCPYFSTLGNLRSNYVGKTFLFFFKGDQFSPIFEDTQPYPSNINIWMQDLSNKPEIMAALEKEKAKQARPASPPSLIQAQESFTEEAKVEVLTPMGMTNLAALTDQLVTAEDVEAYAKLLHKDLAVTYAFSPNPDVPPLEYDLEEYLKMFRESSREFRVRSSKTRIDKISLTQDEQQANLENTCFQETVSLSDSMVIRMTVSEKVTVTNDNGVPKIIKMDGILIKLNYD